MQLYPGGDWGATDDGFREWVGDCDRELMIRDN
jgi:hypothetical protein